MDFDFDAPTEPTTTAATATTTTTSTTTATTTTTTTTSVDAVDVCTGLNKKQCKKSGVCEWEKPNCFSLPSTVATPSPTVSPSYYPTLAPTYIPTAAIDTDATPFPTYESALTPSPPDESGQDFTPFPTVLPQESASMSDLEPEFIENIEQDMTLLPEPDANDCERITARKPCTKNDACTWNGTRCYYTAIIMSNDEPVR